MQYSGHVRQKRHIYTIELAVSPFLLKEWHLSTRKYLFLGHISLQNYLVFVNLCLFPRLTTSIIRWVIWFCISQRKFIFHCNFSFLFTYKVPLITYPDEMSSYPSSATTYDNYRRFWEAVRYFIPTQKATLTLFYTSISCQAKRFMHFYYCIIMR